MIEVNREEALRYLGYRRSIKGDLTPVYQSLDQCIQELQKVVQPKHLLKRFSLEVKDNTIKVNDMVIHSRDLAKNLSGCHAVYLFAGTIGIGVDRLIKRAEVTRMSDAVIYQAVGAAMIEAYCDDVNEQLRKEVQSHGEYLKPRFSPGYGDVALHHQKDFMRLLKMDKIGITLMESLLMVPSKSVTAFIGVTHKVQPRHVKDCKNCPVQCEFRREEE